jgi:hypothetical protein
MHHRSHLSTCKIGCGVLLLPQCLYSGTFQRSYKKWSVDIKKEREVRKTHLSWLNKCEQDLQHQRNRKSNIRYFENITFDGRRKEERKKENIRTNLS